jgi:hypothetical protein
MLECDSEEPFYTLFSSTNYSKKKYSPYIQCLYHTNHSIGTRLKPTLNFQLTEAIGTCSLLVYQASNKDGAAASIRQGNCTSLIFVFRTYGLKLSDLPYCKSGYIHS